MSMFEQFKVTTNIATFIEEELYIPRRTDKHDEIFLLCIDYLLRNIGALKFKNSISKISGESSSECEKFRLNLVNSIYFLRNFKALVVKLAYGTKLSKRELKIKYEVSSEDINTCFRNFKHIDSYTFTKKQMVRVCNLASLDKKLQSLIPEIQTFCRHYVLKKLRFVLKSCNYELHDLVSEILCKAIVTFYFTSTDAKDRLHTLNFIRRTCKNHGLNMIVYFTAKKRSRLNKEGEDFSLMIVSENQMRKTGESTIDYESLSSVLDSSEQVILNVSIKKVANNLTNIKKLKVIKLLMGYHDSSFSSFLRGKGIRYSNDAYIDRVQAKRYIGLVAEHLNIERNKYYYFIEQLKQKLS